MRKYNQKNVNEHYGVNAIGVLPTPHPSLRWYGHVSLSLALAKTILQGTVKGGTKKRHTEEDVGRQHQGMDRPGVRQVQAGSGKQGKMEETCCEIIRGAPTTLTVKGWVR